MSVGYVSGVPGPVPLADAMNAMWLNPFPSQGTSRERCTTAIHVRWVQDRMPWTFTVTQAWPD
jgi:hypothetical protein